MNKTAAQKDIFELKGATYSKSLALLFMILAAGVLIPFQTVKIPFFLGINTLLFGV